MVDIISSAQNPKIKLLLELQQKSQERRRQGLFVVEGRREIERCIQSGYQVDTLIVVVPRESSLRSLHNSARSTV